MRYGDLEGRGGGFADVRSALDEFRTEAVCERVCHAGERDELEGGAAVSGLSWLVRENTENGFLNTVRTGCEMAGNGLNTVRTECEMAGTTITIKTIPAVVGMIFI